MELPYKYTAYGLAIHAEIPLPELTPAASDHPDVRIVLGGLPDALPEPLVRRVTWTARPGEWLQEVKRVARYYVRDGCEVRIEPRGIESDVRAFLFSSVLGALLHQRDWLVLHASAVNTPAGAVAVAGASGAGKSTLLAALLRRGYPMLADDKVAVVVREGIPLVLPGYPSVRLWRDAIGKLDLSTTAMPRLRSGVDKYLYQVPLLHPDPAPLRLTCLLALHNGAHVDVEPLDAVEAFEAVHRNTYQNRLVDAFGQRAAHFSRASILSARVPTVRLLRPTIGDSIGALVDAVESLCGRREMA